MAEPSAWEPLTDAEEVAVWDRLYAEFAFRPSVDPTELPGTREPHPSMTWSFSWPAAYATVDDLCCQMLAAFRACAEPGKAIYALDWQHPCYWFRPHVDVREWAILVLPDGDHHIFLSTDFSWGYFGHPWERTICAFGDPLFTAIEQSTPKLLTNIVRRY